MFGFFKRKKDNVGLKVYTLEPEKYCDIISHLTKDELKVYTEIVQGYRPNETATKLKLTKRNFNDYVCSIFKKLCVNSYRDLILKYGTAFNNMNNRNIKNTFREYERI